MGTGTIVSDLASLSSVENKLAANSPIGDDKFMYVNFIPLIYLSITLAKLQQVSVIL